MLTFIHTTGHGEIKTQVGVFSQNDHFYFYFAMPQCSHIIVQNFWICNRPFCYSQTVFYFVLKLQMSVSMSEETRSIQYEKNINTERLPFHEISKSQLTRSMLEKNVTQN